MLSTFLLTLSYTSPGFYACAVHVYGNTVGKGEIAGNEQFLLFPQCFRPIWATFCHFYQNWNCHLQTPSVWKFVLWDRVEGDPIISAVSKLYPANAFNLNKC